jgi:hypothetical protein
MENDGQKPCQNRLNVAFPTSSESNFFLGNCASEALFCRFFVGTRPKATQMEHFLVFPVFWDNMNLAGHTLKAEKTILDRYFQIHTENC